MHVQQPGWGIAVCGSCSVVGLTFIVRVCPWWFPALGPVCLCISNHCISWQPNRLTEPQFWRHSPSQCALCLAQHAPQIFALYVRFLATAAVQSQLQCAVYKKLLFASPSQRSSPKQRNSYCQLGTTVHLNIEPRVHTASRGPRYSVVITYSPPHTYLHHLPLR